MIALYYLLTIPFSINSYELNYKDDICRIEYCKEYKNINDRIINNILNIGKIRYKVGCNGRYPCKENSYDCSGLIDGTWRDLGIYSGRKLNSYLINQLGKKIKYKESQRGDYIYFDRIDKSSNKPNHIAIVTRGRDGNTIEIADNYEKPGYITKRIINIGGGQYAGIFKIYINRFNF